VSGGVVACQRQRRGGVCACAHVGGGAWSCCSARPSCISHAATLPAPHLPRPCGCHTTVHAAAMRTQPRRASLVAVTSASAVGGGGRVAVQPRDASLRVDSCHVNYSGVQRQSGSRAVQHGRGHTATQEDIMCLIRRRVASMPTRERHGPASSLRTTMVLQPLLARNATRVEAGACTTNY
jgi:hypothetical protein